MKRIIILIISVLVVGCGLNSISKTQYLEPGMTTSQVRDILGPPDSSEFSNGFMVWKYSLQKPWVGYIPHYLAFDGNKRLVAWQAKMNEYYATQNLWLQSLPKQYNVNVNGTVNHNVSGTINVQ